LRTLLKTRYNVEQTLLTLEEHWFRTFPGNQTHEPLIQFSI